MPVHIDALRRLAASGKMAPLIFPGNIGCGRKRSFFSFFRRSEEVSAASFLNFLQGHGIALTGENYIPFTPSTLTLLRKLLPASSTAGSCASSTRNTTRMPAATGSPASRASRKSFSSRFRPNMLPHGGKRCGRGFWGGFHRIPISVSRARGGRPDGLRRCRRPLRDARPRRRACPEHDEWPGGQVEGAENVHPQKIKGTHGRRQTRTVMKDPLKRYRRRFRSWKNRVRLKGELEGYEAAFASRGLQSPMIPPSAWPCRTAFPVPDRNRRVRFRSSPSTTTTTGKRGPLNPPWKNSER